jgi:hypothetical protein
MSAKRWRSLAPAGFPKYEISSDGEVRREGSEEPRALNKNGALLLTDRTGKKRCAFAGKLCREVFGPEAPGATAPRAKLTRKQVSLIRQSTNRSPLELAVELGVSHSTILAARGGVTWAGVPTKTRARYKTDQQAVQDPRAA